MAGSSNNRESILNTDFFRKRFDGSTQVKLEIYRKYLIEWLPTFASQKNSAAWNTINIFDFFSGPGVDSEGQEGSPIIAVNVVLQFLPLINSNHHKVALWFSDKKKKNIAELQARIEGMNLPQEITIHYNVSPFKKALLLNIKNMHQSANLLFIDQFGIKEMTSKVFHSIRGLQQTDIIFFMSSSIVRRFRNHSNIKKHIDISAHMNGRSHADAHRVICDYYRALVPSDINYYLSPFSLKKGANIHGLIFGSSHYKGLLKFLKVCWAIDPERGTANFDIDADNLPQTNETLDFFKTQSSKLDAFEADLSSAIISGSLKSDKAVFMYALESGFLPTAHAKPTLKRLVNDGTIRIEKQIRLGEDCLKEPRQITLC